MSEFFKHKYRVRKGLFGVSILQRLVVSPNGREYKWVDVSYSKAPRALTTEIKE